MIRSTLPASLGGSSILLALLVASPLRAAELRGRIIDAVTGQPVAARLYLSDESGRWHQAQSSDPTGRALAYAVERPATRSSEVHTTLSAHPFHADIPPGKITVRVERGLEYQPQELTVDHSDQGSTVSITLTRWTDLQKKGWFSGDVFLHRPLADCAHLALAEDVNVLFPIHYWTTESGLPPASGNRTISGPTPEPALQIVDSTHVIWPLNTEVELFTVDGRAHMQGAFWVFGHRAPLTAAVPPLGPVASQIKAHGGHVDTEKPNWPWTVMLIPTLQPRFFRLLNNHHWRTAFGTGSWKPVDAPEWMQCERDPQQNLTEDGWTTFGLRLYYALLNSGFRLVPTAGTGSGVHPVPVGFSRTYVEQPDGFSYENWMDRLQEGRCFVSNGPMVLARFDGRPPGHIFTDFSEGVVRIRYEAAAAHGIHRIELIHDGTVAASVMGASDEQSGELQATVTRSGWMALRAWELTPEGRLRLAHTAPVWFEVADYPSIPKAEETAWFIQQVEAERTRHQGVLPDAALAEYEAALAAYRTLHARAR